MTTEHNDASESRNDTSQARNDAGEARNDASEARNDASQAHNDASEAAWLDLDVDMDEDLELELEDREPSDDLVDGKSARMKGRDYFKHLLQLQKELIKLQTWVSHSGAKLMVLFEGRDSAGKGGARGTLGIIELEIYGPVAPRTVLDSTRGR